MKKIRIEFSEKIRDEAIARAKGCCQICGLPFAGKKPEVDHILPAALGGAPILANARAVCKPCHAAKTVKDVRGMRKADRQRRANNGAELPKATIRSRGFAKVGKVKREQLPLPARKADVYGGRL